LSADDSYRENCDKVKECGLQQDAFADLSANNSYRGNCDYEKEGHLHQGPQSVLSADNSYRGDSDQEEKVFSAKEHLLITQVMGPTLETVIRRRKVVLIRKN